MWTTESDLLGRYKQINETDREWIEKDMRADEYQYFVTQHDRRRSAG